MPQLLVRAQQRRPHDVQIVQQRVEFDDACPASRTLLPQSVVIPDDRRHEEQQLHDGKQQRTDVPVSGRQDAETQ